MKVEIYTDGSANLDLKTSGHGYVIYKDKKVFSEGIGYSRKGLTNNEEEYNGVISALEALLIIKFETKPDKVILKSDSELVVKQLTGVYKIRKTHLQLLAKKVKSLISDLAIPVEIMHIPRDENTKADVLAKKALVKASEKME